MSDMDQDRRPSPVFFAALAARGSFMLIRTGTGACGVADTPPQPLGTPPNPFENLLYSCKAFEGGFYGNTMRNTTREVERNPHCRSPKRKRARARVGLNTYMRFPPSNTASGRGNPKLLPKLWRFREEFSLLCALLMHIKTISVMIGVQLHIIVDKFLGEEVQESLVQGLVRTLP